jgi:gluconolactonase
LSFGLNRVVFLIFISAAAASLACSDAQPAIPGIGPIGTIDRLAFGHEFTEGAAVDTKGRVYFSDLKQEKVFRVGPDGTEATFVQKSLRTNGLMVDASRNRLLACESGAHSKTGIARVVAFDLDDGGIKEVVGGYQGRPFNRLNDLVIDRRGGIYFSDILDGGPDLPQDASAVYYASAEGTVTRLIVGLDRPNGVLLSPDEKVLYVLPYGEVTLMAYAVVEPGVLGEGRILANLPKNEARPKAGGDGMAVDSLGNLYVALPAKSAIAVISPGGSILGTISIPEAPSNATFGGPDGRTLYVTAVTSVYSIPMEVTGHLFGRLP